MNEGKPGPSGEEPTTRPQGHDGDFELAHPARDRATEPADEGDYELDRPQEPTGPVPPGGPIHGSDTPQHPAEPAPAGSGARASDSLTGPVGERRGPLHDPDPYSTPPYGEPGPWAPAPPVQHPATTPAHGMAVAAPPTAPETPPQGTAPPAPAPDPTAPPQQGATLAHGAAPHQGAVPAPAPDPAHGVPPVPAPDPATAPRQGGALTHGAPTTPAPAHGEPPVPAPDLVKAPHGAAPAPAPAPHPDAVPPGAPTAPHIPAQARPDADPWGRYDPWAAAAAAPLQQAEPALVSEKQRRRRGRRVLIGAALVLALVSGGVGGAIGTYLERNGGVDTVELPQAGKEDVARDPGSVAGIAEQALPSVVTLHVSGADEAGTGTGFVLDGRGHILTNNHVVEPAGDRGEITVTFNSGDTAEATVVGRDSGYDLAVVKVKGVSGLTPLPLGNSDNVRVGDPVVAIGAPFDLAGTVTSGIISARERPITAGGEKGDGSDVSYVDALQTDAPINPGNSGGPLLDAKAHVIGINSAIRSAAGGADPEGGQAGSIGLGFAIPINQGKRVAEELINTGKASHPVIGITLDMEYGGDGARVAAKGSDGGPPVSTGGPGAKAGIKAGDVITQVDGQRVHSGEELIVKTRAHRPGDRLELTLERDGEERTLTLTLGSSGGG
ncbi:MULTISPECIES: trypsin-like peptidase domain-containing protein [Streptomyces]|uniref:Trypsin-like peptidase domain-containing protein n=1 Tax=Streptomyces edwardsiae TaxID=3075527 RepID=A0ABU2Q4F1_9ACTN|nr:trypsin-like peptidase domain-containing protein [Streptomyces sp. DSM 41636]MDT0399312.1 trypsin-like peptidase domain-containing protein [Streptomyces sp. DSM 41636]